MSEKSDLTPLSWLDSILYLNVVCLYYYNGTLGAKRVEEYLEETIKDVPIISSVIVKKDEKLFFKNVTPSNVTLTVKHDCPEELYTNYKPDKDGILSFAEGSSYYKFIDCIQTNPMNPLVPILDTPNVKLTLLITKETKKSIIAISINHALADAHTLIYFMQRLSLGKAFKEFKFDVSRKYLQPSNDDCDIEKKTDKKTLDILQVYHPHNMSQDKNFIGARFGADVVTKVIHFSKERIEQLKKMVNFDGKFSSNDVVCAHMWKLFSGVGNLYKEDTENAFRVIVNFRNRVTGIGEGYIGNAVVGLNSSLKKHEVREIQFSDIVKRIRGLVNSVDDKLVKTLLDCVKKYSSQYPMMMRKTNVTIDDWRMIDIKKPGSFGQENILCERTLMCPPMLPMFSPQWYFVHLSEEKGGIDVKLSFDKLDYEKIKHIKDLSDPNSLDKIYKIFKE